MGVMELPSVDRVQSGSREYRKGPSDRTLTGLALAAGLTPLSLSLGVREDMLETLVPKVEGNRVMGVRGQAACETESRAEASQGRPRFGTEKLPRRVHSNYRTILWSPSLF